METEYIALSMGMRELVGSMKLMREITLRCKLKREETSNASWVCEDNEAALKHAITALPKLSPRTKHIAVKYHWFKKRIELGIIEMFSISTKQQKIDIFTKGLGTNQFQEKRKLLMGWWCRWNLYQINLAWEGELNYKDYYQKCDKPRLTEHTTLRID